MSIVRTFIAVEVSAGVQSRALALIERLRSADANVRWVEPEAMHLTLKFLGDIDLTATAEVCRAVARAVEPVEPFELNVSGAGAFPGVERPRTVWLGARDGAPQLVDLAERVDTALIPLKFKPERRPYHPHLTLGRVRGSKNLPALSEAIIAAANFEAGVIAIDELVVFASHLERGGPHYEPLGHIPL